MAKNRDFRDLIIWQKGIALAKAVYDISRKFPKEERFGLTAQVRRAAVSVSSNVAEGHARRGDAFGNFLSIAVGSAAEVQSQMLLSVALGYVGADDITEVLSLGEEVKRIGYALIDKV